jgi:hypothetical protein
MGSCQRFWKIRTEIQQAQTACCTGRGFVFLIALEEKEKYD